MKIEDISNSLQISVFEAYTRIIWNVDEIFYHATRMDHPVWINIITITLQVELTDHETASGALLHKMCVLILVP